MTIINPNSTGNVITAIKANVFVSKEKSVPVTNLDQQVPET